MPFTTIGGIIGYSIPYVGPVTGPLFAAGGAYLDTNYVYPAVFGGPPDIVGPRIDDRGFQTASEGSPIKFAMGNEVRVTGTLIWQTELIELQKNSQAGKGGNKQTTSTFTYFVSVAIGVCEGEISHLRKVWADSKLIWDDGVIGGEKFGSLTIYLGTETQTADPIIEAEEGIGNVPGYRGLAYVVIEGLELSLFGNRIPHFTFLIAADNTKTVGEAIGALCERGGLSSLQYDVTRVDGCMIGYHVSGAQPIVRAIEPLMMAYNLNVQEKDGKLVFFHGGEEETQTVDAADLAAHESGVGSARRLFDRSNASDFDLFAQVSVTFIEPLRESQQGSQIERRMDLTLNVNRTFNLPLALTATEAKNVAQRIMWTSAAERAEISFQLPPSYLHLTEGDVVPLIQQGETTNVKIVSATKGVNGVIEFRGTTYEQQTYTTNAIAADPDFTTPSLYEPPETSFAILDIPALLEDHIYIFGYYFAVCATDRLARWRGATLFRTPFGPTSFFVPLFDVEREAVTGKSLTQLEPGDVGRWDYENTLDVIMLEGALSSSTEIDVLDGANVLIVGQEIMAFQTATLIATNTYRLSKLLRGLRQTSVEDHKVNDLAFLYNPDTVLFIGDETRFRTRRFKAVAAEGVEANYPYQEILTTQRTLQRMNPTIEPVYKDGDDRIFVFKRVSRSLQNLFTGGIPAIEHERFELHIHSGGPFTSVVRVIDFVHVIYTKHTISVVSGDSSFNDSLSDFLNQGFVPGQWIDVTDTIEPENSGRFKIVSVTAAKIIVDATLIIESVGARVTMGHFYPVLRYTSAQQVADRGTNSPTYDVAFQIYHNRAGRRASSSGRKGVFR